jgi:hypothetical protein
MASAARQRITASVSSEVPMFQPAYIVVIVAVVLALMVVGLVVGRHLEKKRTEQMAAVAQELDFSFTADAAVLLATGIGGLPLVNRGHSKKARNAMEKTVRGTAITLLDYQYTVGSGKHQHTHRHSVAVFRNEQAAFPDFEVKPENFFHRIGALFGYQDIDFDTHRAFSKKYLVRGSNEPAIRATFSPEVLDFLQSSAVQWSIESRSSWIAIYHAKRVRPEEVRQFLADTTRIFLLFAPKTDMAAET